MKPAFVCLAVTALLLFQAASLTLAGYSYTCTAAETGGAWNVNSTWVDCANGVPGADDIVLVSGPKAVVTIASGQSISAQHIKIENSATLTSLGSINVVWLDVNDAKVTSTGKVSLVEREDGYFYPGLDADNSDVKLSSDLIISGRAYFYIEESDVTVGGSVNVTGIDGNEVELDCYESRFTIAGDFILNGGLYGSSGSFSKRSEAQEQGKRGSSLSLSGHYLALDSSFVQIKGDLVITSRDHTANTTDEYSSTADVGLGITSSQLVVGGDLRIQSGDAVVASTGGAYVRTSQFPAVALPSIPAEYLYEIPSGEIVVGGSVTVMSGSITGAHNDSSTGSAVFDLVKTEVYINGTKSSLSVQSGSSGFQNGNDGAYVALGAGSRLGVTNDVVVQSGNGGNGVQGDDNGGSADAAFLAVFYGGEVLVGGDLSVSSGNGGNAANAEDSDANAGSGGYATVAVINGGSISVAGDMTASSGSSGLGARGGDAYEATVIMSSNLGQSQPQPTELPIALERVVSQHAARGVGSYSVAGGASNLRVGGDLNITSGSAGSTTSSSYNGGDCDAQFSSGVLGEAVSGLVVENIWDGEVIVGGDINIRGCNAGDSVYNSGGQTSTSGLVATGGVSVDVYGSISVQAGHGGSTMGSSSASSGGTGFVVAFSSSDINVAGSLTTTSGNGGDVINGTGQPGRAGNSAVSAYSNSHINVKRAITVNGGSGGNLNSADGNGITGGDANGAIVQLYDRSSIVAASLRILMGSTGNATSSAAASPVEKREEPQKASFTSRLLEKLNLADSKRGKGQPSSGVRVSGMSSLTINGDLAVVAGPTSFSTYAAPVGGGSAHVSVDGFSTATIKGDITIVAESCGSTLSEFYELYDGGRAELYVSEESVVKARGNVRLQGGDACTGPNSTTGTQGVAYFELTERAQFYQSGLFVLRDGKGQNETNPESSTGISMERSEWTVYPCAGAGVEMTQRNSSFFQMSQFATFKDCRGSGARQRYPEPTTDGSADGSCSPCTCKEVALSSCPNKASSSAGHVEVNSVVAWLLAAML